MNGRFLSAILCLLLGLSVVPDAGAAPGATANAAADAGFVDGKWVGQGIFQLGPKVYSCPNSWQVFVGNAQVYQVRDAFVECDQDFRQSFTVISTFEVKPNGDLYFADRSTGQSRKTGEIRGNVLRTDFEQNGMTNSIEIILNGPFMLYRDTMGVPGQQPFFSFVGIFRKVAEPAEQQQSSAR